MNNGKKNGLSIWLNESPVIAPAISSIADDRQSNREARYLFRHNTAKDGKRILKN
jgi:hypothetical protein